MVEYKISKCLPRTQDDDSVVTRKHNKTTIKYHVGILLHHTSGRGADGNQCTLASNADNYRIMQTVAPTMANLKYQHD